jgi:CubicO group peptidase (beta-lactamase class C family)
MDHGSAGSDWQESSPEEQGLDAARLDALDREIRDRLTNLSSFLIIRHDRIVFERYYQGHDRTDPFSVRSVTKSVISALIGVALREGHLTGLDQRVASFFPDHAGVRADRWKRQITLEHLLTMTAGLAWDDGRLGQLWTSDDWVDYVLGLPMAHEPGTVFTYSDGASQLLSAVITSTTRLSARDYGVRRLFGPLGIAAPDWDTDPRGLSIGAWGLFLTARELATFGRLYLDGGLWEGRPIIPAWYVTASTSRHSAGGYPEEADYGYHWWVASERGYPTYFAAGYGGQYLVVIPSLRLIVVTTARWELPRRNYRTTATSSPTS